MRTYNETELQEMWEATPLPFKQLLMEVAFATDQMAHKNPDYPVDVFSQTLKVTDAANALMLSALTYKTAASTHAEYRAAIITVMAQALRLLQINNHAPQLPKVVPMVNIVDNDFDKRYWASLPEELKPKTTGLFTCTAEWQNEMQYTWKVGQRLQVVRYNELYHIAICQIPGEEQPFEMPIEKLEQFFKPVNEQS